MRSSRRGRLPGRGLFGCITGNWLLQLHLDDTATRADHKQPGRVRQRDRRDMPLQIFAGITPIATLATSSVDAATTSTVACTSVYPTAAPSHAAPAVVAAHVAAVAAAADPASVCRPALEQSNPHPPGSGADHPPRRSQVSTSDVDAALGKFDV